MIGLFSKKNRGFTLLFAVLTASVLLSLALAIFNQIYKSLLLSSAGKESLAAFYAADSGVECAFYWDLKHDPINSFPNSIFATSSYSVNYGGSNLISCNEQKFNQTWTVTSDLFSATTVFNLSFGGGIFPTEGCSEVTVNKTVSGDNIFTTIESRGYNICDAGSPRKVERAIQVTY